MKIIILTLFPNLFEPFFNTSIIGRAVKQKLLEYQLVDIRQFGKGPHQVIDDRPYGGGVGMIMKADVLSDALHSILHKQQTNHNKQHTILMSASGIPFKHSKARELSRIKNLIIVCGRYEGVDERFVEGFVDEELSIGDFVLNGGEVAAMAVIEAVVRLIPKVLTKEEAVLKESFTQGSLEHPHYTRPEVFNGKRVPEVLLSGNHQEVERWRQEQSLIKTKKVRPDLISKITQKDCSSPK